MRVKENINTGNEKENESPREDNKKKTGSEATDAKRLIGRSWNVASIGLQLGLRPFAFGSPCYRFAYYK